MTKYVYRFSSGGMDLKDLLGGKGANLAEMTKLGLPVPPGFTITTQACRTYLATGEVPGSLFAEVADHLREIELQLDRRLGDPANPLLVSVRSGAKFSMPGMMETVLDIGLNDSSVAGLAAHTGDERFAWDSYRRLIGMFAKTLGVPGEEFEDALAAARQTAGVASDTGLSAEALRDLVETYKKIFHVHTGRDFPQAPHEQLNMAIRAVFRSWNSERA
ncbi:MAG: pyruvate, orthophosphate dikinase, partial [Cryptosporangiaceae bacterium]|nr:pyruvate, orthophosphate dikinase [Cryptosporangiaceae bacterium]